MYREPSKVPSTSSDVYNNVHQDCVSITHILGPNIITSQFQGYDLNNSGDNYLIFLLIA